MRRAFSKYLQPSWNLRVQILSDLHLELGQQYSSFTFPVTAPLLLLAGDIGRLIDYDNYLAFLEAQISRYENVFLVLGNHEFYGMAYNAGLDTAQRLIKEATLDDRVILRHKTRWDSPRSNLSILGCTLWSSIPFGSFEIVQSKVNDFKKIEGWNPTKHNDVHADEVAWLRAEVTRIATIAHEDKESPRKLLIATHHAPCIDGTSRPEHLKNPWTVAFATDLLSPEAWNPVKIWVLDIHTIVQIYYETALG